MICTYGNVKDDSKYMFDNIHFENTFVRHTQSMVADFLKDHQLSFFEFARVFDDGRCIRMNTIEGFIKYAFTNKVPISAYIDPKIQREQFVYFIPATQYPQVTQEIQSLFGVNNYIEFIQKHHSYYDQFSMGYHAESEFDVNYYINAINDIWSFCFAFRVKAKDHIKYLEKHPLQLPNMMRSNISSLSAGQDTAFRKTLEMVIEARLSLLTDMLTPREQDCVKALFFGHTSAEMAKAFNISVRTAEAHILSVKNKIQCKKKSEIVSTIISNSFFANHTR